MQFAQPFFSGTWCGDLSKTSGNCFHQWVGCELHIGQHAIVGVLAQNVNGCVVPGMHLVIQVLEEQVGKKCACSLILAVLGFYNTFFSCFC